jgi:hypothetical protein
MHRLLIAVIAIAILFCLLCGPAWYVALRLWRRGDLDAFRPLRAVWAAQVVLACGLLFAADTIGVPNPAAWMAGIFAGVSLGGAALFGSWRLARGAAGRQAGRRLR